MTRQQIEGVTVAIAGREYVVPPLTFAQIKRLTPVINKLTGIDPEGPLSLEYLDDVLTIIHQAMSRNYPDLGREELEEILDLGNALKIMKAIMGVSGFVQGGEVQTEGLIR